MKTRQTKLSALQRLRQMISRLRHERADTEGYSRFLDDSIIERKRYEQARRKQTEVT